MLYKLYTKYFQAIKDHKAVYGNAVLTFLSYCLCLSCAETYDMYSFYRSGENILSSTDANLLAKLIFLQSSAVIL